MRLLAELAMSPGGVISWVAIGLIAGWMAGLVMSGSGFGVIRDIVLGLIGAVVGGFFAAFFVRGDAGFWESMVIAFIGACMLIGVARALLPDRARG